MTAYDFRSDTVTLPTAEMMAAIAAAPLADSARGDDPDRQRARAARRDADGQGRRAVPAVGHDGKSRGGDRARLPRRRGDRRGDGPHLQFRRRRAVGAGRRRAAAGARQLWRARSGRREGVDRRAGRVGAGADAADLSGEHPQRVGRLRRVAAADGGDSCTSRARRAFRVHLDGARLFNAATYLGVPIVEICKHTDSVWFALCKGLGAPVGAILAGDTDFMARARHAAQDAGRRDAAGGRDRGARHRRTEGPLQRAPARPCAGAAAGARACRDRSEPRRRGAGPHQHRQLLRRPFCRRCRGDQPALRDARRSRQSQAHEDPLRHALSYRRSGR